MEGRNDDVRNPSSFGQERKERNKLTTIVVRLMVGYNSGMQ